MICVDDRTEGTLLPAPKSDVSDEEFRRRAALAPALLSI